MGNFVWLCSLAAISLILIFQVEGSNQGLPIGSLSPRVSSARTATTCKNIFGPICGDCNTLWTCLGGETAYKTQNCEKDYPGQPYCVDGACSSSPDPNDEQCSTGITCTAAGYFPNPLNCSQYYFCEGPNGASMSYECPAGYFYNTVVNECKRRIFPTDCGTINCASNPDRYVAYTANPVYYALCLVTDGVTTPLMFKCLDPLNEIFMQSQRRCVFQCKAEGKVPDSKDCSKFYECYRNGLTYTSVHQKCLNGFIFSIESNGCVKGTCPVVDEGGDGEDGEIVK